jgi:acyl carrier protein
MKNVQQEIHNYIVDKILFDNGEKIDEDLSFQESGILDSTGFLELITFVEEKFGVEVSDRELIPENFDTLRKISGFVQSKRQSDDLDCISEVSGG